MVMFSAWQHTCFVFGVILGGREREKCVGDGGGNSIVEVVLVGD